MRGVALAASLLGAACQSTVHPDLPLDAPGTILIVPFAEEMLVPVNPANPAGPAIGVLRGDPQTGASDMLMRLPKGPIPMHAHTHDYALMVIEGQIQHWGLEGSQDSAELLGPGSYWFQPRGVAHAHNCVSEFCLVSVHWSGPQDVWLVDVPEAEG